MNDFQKLWWRQVQSDIDVLELLKKDFKRYPPCHQLHYLQMVTEKLGKAYLWRSKNPPDKNHASFVLFLRALGSVSISIRPQVARIFGFSRFDDFQAWLRQILPLAYQLQRMAPQLAEDGPNPEYPWPHSAPLHVPAEYDFGIWHELNTGRGRQFIQVITAAVKHFELYA
jgi:hypothetical protein